jgi:hypothetical protein
MLSSSNTALVVVTAYIPPICRKSEKIDVEITLPDGSETSSLAGGWLMPCYLREMALMKGELHQGKEIVMASGPVLVDALGGTKDGGATAALRRGRIPGGGKYVGEDRVLTVAIKNEYRTVRMSRQLADRIGKRFYDYDTHGIRRPLAEAKTNARIELIVHERYRDNYPRYLQCIRALSLNDTPVEKHMKIQELAEKIQFGPTAEMASLQLEALGPDSIPALKKGLASPDLEARFHAGVALAYLGNSDGVPALKEAASKEPAFRIFSLAALSALPDGSAAEALKGLMNEESVEGRYGAFRAFSTMAPNDPFIRGVEMDGHFSLHPVESTGSPLVHITRYKKAEVVVFDDHQRFLTPLVLRAGNRILLRGSAHDQKISVKRIAPGEQPREQIVSTNVVEVIKAASDLGATYPDIVEMLVEAEAQHNLPGRLAIDELPRTGRMYERPSRTQTASSDIKTDAHTEGVTVGSSGVIPNLFNEQPVQVEQAPEEPAIPSNPKDSKLKKD